MEEEGKPMNEKFKRLWSDMDEEFENIEKRNAELAEAWKAFFESTRVIPDFYQNNRKIGFEQIKKQLDELPETRDKLSFVMDQYEIFNKLLIEAKLAEQGYETRHFKAFLDEVLLPLKTQLVERIDFENKYGLTSVKQKETIHLQKITEPKPEIVQNKPDSEILDPFSKENETPNKNKKDNFKKIGLKWSDERIPELLAELFVDRELIFENQKSLLIDFFKHANCKPKIQFRKNGNVLVTAFYELEGAHYLKFVNKFLAEKIEENFVHFTDTLKPLLLKDSVIASLSPGKVNRRINDQYPDYVNGVTYLHEKLNLKG